MSAGIVSVENVSLKFKLQQNRADTLKEFCALAEKGFRLRKLLGAAQRFI